MDLPNFLATHRPLKRKLGADDDDASAPQPQHPQQQDHQLPHQGPQPECSGSGSSTAGGSAGGISISISITPAAPRQPWIADAEHPAAAAAARWASPSPSPIPSPISSPTATTVPQVSSPLSQTRAPKRLRLNTQDAVLRPGHSHSRNAMNSAMKHYPRRSAVGQRTPLPTPMSPGMRHGSDLEDIGVVSRAAPGPSSGSLLRPPRGPGGARASGSGKASGESPVSTAPANAFAGLSPTVKLSRSPHIPPMTPLITRATLRELELDVILRNPVIRHDLLFDPGLQFRPRRTRAACERYWDAVWREVRLGCTCVTLDLQGGVHPTRCICENASRSAAVTMPPSPCTPTPISSIPSTPIVCSSPSTPLAQHTSQQLQPLYTLRTPPRLPLLLAELRAVLLLVVQPLSASSTAVYTNPAAVRAQAEEHARHAGELREVLDGVLEAGSGSGHGQGMGSVDLGPVFARIGATLKRHCAPMRDRRVDAMVGAATQGGVRAFSAVRMCLELLELMKLDIANHQLAQLRPWLLRNTSAFEAKAFRIRFGSGPRALRHTRAWLADADRALCGASAETLAPGPLAHTPYACLTRNQRIYLSVLKGLVDLVFCGAPGEVPALTLATKEDGKDEGVGGKDTGKDTASLDSSQPMTLKKEDNVVPPSSSAPVLPETLYLDKTRLASLATEASDSTSLYMLALLFRQLLSADNNTHIHADVDTTEALGRLRTELRVLAPAGLGVCLVPPEVQNEEHKKKQSTDVEMSPVEPHDLQRAKKEKDAEEERGRRRRVREDVVLQIASRAEDVRQRWRAHSVNAANPSSFTTIDAPAQNATPTAPPPALLALAQRWATTHMQPSSPLARLLHTRVRDAVLDEVIALVYPTNTPSSSTSGVDISIAGGLRVFTGRAAHPAPLAYPLGLGAAKPPVTGPPPPLVDAERKSALGLDSLAGEIRRLAVRVARLAEVHLGTHLPMYESEGFLEEEGAEP